MSPEEKKDSLEQLYLALQHAREDVVNRMAKKNTAPAVGKPLYDEIAHLVANLITAENAVEKLLDALD